MVIVNACDDALAGKPYSGNLSLRFDEGSGLNIHSYSTKGIASSRGKVRVEGAECGMQSAFEMTNEK